MTHNNQQQSAGVPPELWLSPLVFTRIKETIGARKAESGGMLGGNRESGEVTAFCFDADALEQSAGAYSPNHIRLTRVLKEEWKPKGIQFLGFVHSHPPHYTHPSPWDEEYAGRLMKKMELPYLLLPIIRTAVDTGAFALFPYVAICSGSGIEVIKQVLRIGDGASFVFKQVREERGGDLLLPDVPAATGDTAVDFPTTDIALSQAMRSLKPQHQQDKGENSHER